MTSEALESYRRGLGLAAHPPGLAGLYFTELWERFSFYGMRALLLLFMVAPAAAGGLGFATPTAGSIYGTYTMAVYLLAVPGGFIADRILGAKRSVLIGGTAIAAGHYALAVPSLTAFYAGLMLIALGTGLFKPNISALVGALYQRDDVRRDAGFSLFYMGINVGAFFAPLITGFLAQSALFKGWLAAVGFDPAKSWHWGFAAAGVGMTISMLLFARSAADLKDPDPRAAEQTTPLSRDGIVIAIATVALLGLALLSDVDGFTWLRWMFLVLPLAGVAYGAAQQNPDARRLAAVGIYFIAAMIFWALYEQAGTTFALFADTLTRNQVLGFAFPSAWYQSANPIFIILLTPFAAALWLKLGRRQPSAPVKFGLGLRLPRRLVSADGSGRRLCCGRPRLASLADRPLFPVHHRRIVAEPSRTFDDDAHCARQNDGAGSRALVLGGRIRKQARRRYRRGLHGDRSGRADAFILVASSPCRGGCDAYVRHCADREAAIGRR